LPAFVAKLRGRTQLRAAARARAFQRCRTLLAELRAGAVLVMARNAIHPPGSRRLEQIEKLEHGSSNLVPNGLGHRTEVTAEQRVVPGEHLVDEDIAVA